MSRSNSLWCLLANMFFFLHVQSKLHPEEVCGNVNGRRMYVELGSRGTVIARNLHGVGNDSHIDSYKQCRFEFTSCPACVISIKFTFLNISQNCNKSPILDSCSCDYVWLYEPPFHDISGHQYCGYYTNNDSTLHYTSQTRTVIVIFFYMHVYEHAFTLEYASERNRQFIQGAHGNGNQTQTISTPFFPHPYLRDLNVEYVIRCTAPKTCKICLVFTDFLIAKMSVIEFLDWNGRRLTAATGMVFRPPTIISTGPALSIRFYANGATNKGFKIAYKFLSSDSDTKSTINSKIDCGGLVDNLGGGITKMDVVKEATQFDCVWIVQPSRNFAHFYKHLYLKVVAFSDFGGSTELTIHQGLTSSGARLEMLRYPLSSSEGAKQGQHIIPIDQGFYIRFKGVLRTESKLGIAYTAFGYNECIPGTDFLCKNKRCIPIYLQCDGFDHCGDNSDEPPSCFQDSKRHRWSHTSNFFFPKAEQYSDFHTAAIVFIVCCFGMVSLILALIILIFRINGRARQQREMENHLQAISDFLDQDAASFQEEIIEGDDPPDYEPPPDYEEIGNNIIATARQDSAKSKSPKRNTCTRCSQRIYKSHQVKIVARRAENSTNGVGTSGRYEIPDSPPPAYLSHILQSNMELNVGTTAIAGTSFSTFGGNFRYGSINNEDANAQGFLTQDFRFLKKKVQQKTKKRKINWKLEHAKKFFPNFCESDLNHCLSDSEVSEINSGYGGEYQEETTKMQRSFSFDDF